MTRGRGLLPGLHICGLKLAIVLLSSLLLGSLAQAEDDWDDDEDAEFNAAGSYLALGFNHGNEGIGGKIGKTDGSNGMQQVAGHVSGAEGLHIVFGMRAIDFFAAEVEYEFLDGFNFGNTAGDKIKIQTHSFTVNGKIFPLHWWLNDFNQGRLQPSLLFGVGMMSCDDLSIKSPRAVMLRMGGAVDYFINSKWSVFAKSSYVLPYGNLAGLRYVSTSVGMRYHLD